MEIKIKPLSGCLRVFLGVMTLGVAPLLARLNERNWPQAVDDQGLLTRGGMHIAWQEFSRITKVTTTINNSGPGVVHYELKHPKGKVIVAPYRLENGDAVLDFIWERLPEQAKHAQS